MLDHVIMSAVQMRIVLTLFLDGEIGTATVLRRAGISWKTWSKEKDALTALGLLASQRRRIVSDVGVKVVHHHKLTSKGEEIAARIAEISKSLARPGTGAEEEGRRHATDGKVEIRPVARLRIAAAGIQPI